MDRLRPQLIARRGRPWAAALAAALVASACRDAPRAVAAKAAVAAPASSRAPAGLERFQQGLAPVDSLRGGEGDAASLLRRVARAAAAHDTATLARAAVSRAEWAWLYYPASRYTRPPYQSPPELQWGLTLAASEKGVGRLIRELGGHRIVVHEVACDAPTREGANILWRGCDVAYSRDGVAQRRRLAGTLLERDGAVKVLSYANDF